MNVLSLKSTKNNNKSIQMDNESILQQNFVL